MKTIGIIGTRRKDNLTYFLKVNEQFKAIYKKEDVICSGLCSQGGDFFALLISLGMEWTDYSIPARTALIKRAAQNELNYSIQSLWFPADWKTYGKAAGFKRNTDIALHSDILIAVVADDRTGGTEDTINKWKHLHPYAELKKNLHLIL